MRAGQQEQGRAQGRYADPAPQDEALERFTAEGTVDEFLLRVRRGHCEYFASAFAIFLLRQTFMGIPKELDEAARVEGASPLQILWRVYVPLAKPVYVAFALVSVSFHWNNFLWPLIVTNSVNSRPLTVGLQVFSSVDQGVDWSIITAATLLTSAPLLVAFLLFQRQFVQSFMRAGIK